MAWGTEEWLPRGLIGGWGVLVVAWGVRRRCNKWDSLLVVKRAAQPLCHPALACCCRRCGGSGSSREHLATRGVVLGERGVLGRGKAAGFRWH